jgi:glycosyltransferase involved in cell wall biosynthesis
MPENNYYPLVTIVCLCYNHELFVAESLRSVLAQTYQPIQIIVIDDASTDNSVAVIRQTIAEVADITCIFLEKNVGNCKAFNKGLALAKGEFIIDFATDDVMHMERVAKQVAHFQVLDSRYGVSFTDAFLIDSKGKKIKTYYKRSADGTLLQNIPQGNVYLQQLKRAFICTPTMMVRTKILIELGGYDETLSYEDYDFWIRSSRICQYAYLDELLTYKRILFSSHGRKFYVKKVNEKHLESTLLISKKALQNFSSAAEYDALAVSVRYHYRLSFYTENFIFAHQFYDLLRQITKPSLTDKFIYLLSKIKIRVFGAYKIFQQIRAFYKR